MSFHSKKVRRKKLPYGKIAVSIIVLAAVFFGGQELYYRMQLQKVAPATSQIHAFIVSSGETPASIAKRLENEGFIKSAWVFLRYGKRSGDANEYQAGKFYMPKGLFVPQLSEKLTKATLEEIKVTIPEGLTNAEIDQRLSELELIEAGDFLQCVADCDFSEFPFLPSNAAYREGFFFPDTYFVSPAKFTVEEFAQRLIRTFDTKTKSIFGSSSRNGWDILKMASIVEKEAAKEEERPMVAGILWKRFDNDWSLGADATTRYITGKATDPLTIADLRDQNPWNTRAVKGLPPGAIANPGLSAIWAAANPQESEYWYYLHGNDGQIRYAETESEHNANKQQYL
jgi:UPF0755 protein